MTGRSQAPTDVVCRPAEPGDLPGVAELFLASRAAAVPAMPPVPAAAEDVVRRDIASWDLAHRETWVAETAGAGGRPELVGFATVARDWLEALYVAPTAQRRGVGTMLLDLVAALRPGGFCLWVFDSNAPARRFYADHGLLELERTDGSRNPERTPDVRMVWPGEAPLRSLRGLIDEVDEDLGEVLARRAALTRVVQAHKSDTDRDPAREADVVRRVAHAAAELGEERVRRIMDVVIAESLDAAGAGHGP